MTATRQLRAPFVTSLILGLLIGAGSEPVGAQTAKPGAGPLRQATFELRHEVRVKIPDGARRVRVWMALPQDNEPAQQVRDLRIDAPYPYRIERDSEGSRVLYLEAQDPAVKAPAVTLRDLDGRPLTLRDLRGQVVFVNFWATWCVPCRNEMPALENLYRAYRDRGFVVVGVNFRESAGVVRGFMQELRLSFPALVDTDAAVSRAFGVRGLPVSFLLDREGRILWKAIGSREWDSSHGRTYLDDVLRLQPR